MHGGALAGLADTAVVMAIKSLVPPDTPFVTVSLETEFLRAVRRGIVTAKAEIVGRVGQWLHGEAAVYDEEGQLAVRFSSTSKITAGRGTEGTAS